MSSHHIAGENLARRPSAAAGRRAQCSGGFTPIARSGPAEVRPEEVGPVEVGSVEVGPDENEATGAASSAAQFLEQGPEMLLAQRDLIEAVEQAHHASLSRRD
jgi:hypothetical protein